MIPVREILVNYVEFEKPQMVCLGDGRMVEALGRENIHLTMVLTISSSKRVTMYNALYVPNLKCNLFFFVKAAATKGNAVKFGEAKCWIFGKNGMLYGMGTVSDKLYYLDCFSTTQDHAAVASQPQSGSIDLWHQRLGHLSGAQLKEMATCDMVKGMKVTIGEDLSFYEDCVEGKMSRQPYQSVGEIRLVRKL